MSSSESDIAATDVPLDEPQSTPSKKAGRGKGKGKGKVKVKGRKMSKQSVLTDEQKEEVLDFLRHRPYIYDKGHRDYKDSPRRAREWAEFAERLGLEVVVVLGWYRSMRTMLARAKKVKSKSGSGSMDLSRSLEWVWLHMSFMTPYIASLSADPVCYKRKRAAPDPSETDTELDPGQAGPSQKAPCQASASSTSRTSAAPPAPGPSVQPVGSTPKAATDSSASSTNNCCGHLCTQLGKIVQHLSEPQAEFWKTIQSRSRTLDEEEILEM